MTLSLFGMSENLFTNLDIYPKNKSVAFYQVIFQEAGSSNDNLVNLSTWFWAVSMKTSARYTNNTCSI